MCELGQSVMYKGSSMIKKCIIQSFITVVVLSTCAIASPEIESRKVALAVNNIMMAAQQAGLNEKEALEILTRQIESDELLQMHKEQLSKEKRQRFITGLLIGMVIGATAFYATEQWVVPWFNNQQNMQRREDVKRYIHEIVDKILQKFE